MVWIQNKGFPTGGHHVGSDAVVEKVFKRFAIDWQSWRFDRLRAPGTQTERPIDQLTQGFPGAYRCWYSLVHKMRPFAWVDTSSLAHFSTGGCTPSRRGFANLSRLV